MPSYCFDGCDMVNKRIDELFGQALDAAVPETWTTLNMMQVKLLKDKFAELIVEECIDVVLSSDPSPKMIVHEPYRTIMNNIVEHFGVEE